VSVFRLLFEFRFGKVGWVVKREEGREMNDRVKRKKYLE